MTKIEENCLKLAELDNIHGLDFYSENEIYQAYSNFDILMSFIIQEISEYELKAVHFEVENIGLLESVQNYVIKYLEAKNDQD